MCGCGIYHAVGCPNRMADDTPPAAATVDQLSLLTGLTVDYIAAVEAGRVKPWPGVETQLMRARDVLARHASTPDVSGLPGNGTHL